MKSRDWPGALVGVLTAAVGIGVGEFAAVFVRPAAAPIIALGNKIILLTPESAKKATIQSVGTNDKLLLFVSMYVGLALFGVIVGLAAARDLRLGLAGVALFGAFGCYCALTVNAAQGRDVIPALVGTAAAGVTLWLLTRWLGAEDGPAGGPGRRTFLAGTAGAAGIAALGGFGGRAAIHARFDVAQEREKLALPAPADPAPPLPRGVELAKSDNPFATPTADFYRIDTAIDVPQVDPNTWKLRIHGMVDHETELTFAQLLKRPMMERWITLCCVSNGIGGPLIGNAKWLGAPLTALLREAGVHDDADQLLMTSIDGLTIGAPTKVVMDGRDALLAVGMNGAPLPTQHGFPVRVVVPGLYGYVSACKWVVDIEATTFARRKAYWVDGGWAAHPDIKLESRIDTPSSGAKVKAGQNVVFAGVAWDQHVGVSKVEVQIEGQPWRTARLAAVPSTDTWRQWVFPWTFDKAGQYFVTVRATDAHGKTQTAQQMASFPEGATGRHRITMVVT